MLSDLGIDQLAAMRLQPGMGPFLVGADQPRLAGDIGGENSSQPAFDVLSSQAALLDRPRNYRLSDLS
jgi:hypothetical protein